MKFPLASFRALFARKTPSSAWPRTGKSRGCPYRPLLELLEDRLSPASLGFSSYLGGAQADSGTVTAVDSSGNVYVAGSTSSVALFPTQPALSQIAGPDDSGGAQQAFVAKFSSAGTLLYASHLGGVSAGDSTTVTGLAVDNSGRAYITGFTNATDLPTTANAISKTSSGGTHAFFTILDTTSNAVTFSNTSNPAAGTTPQAITAADFNGDGFPDIAVANSGSNNVTVSLNNGAGSFPAASSTNYGSGGFTPGAIVAAPFVTGKGNSIVVGNEGGGGLKLLANNGSGTFSLSTGLMPGIPEAAALAVGRITATGSYNIDSTTNASFVVADDLNNAVKTYLGDGTGNFTNVATDNILGVFTSPHALALQDFNDDGKLDLVVVDNTGVYVLPGNGDGTFNVAGMITLKAGFNFTSVTAGGTNLGDTVAGLSPESFEGATFANGHTKGDIAVTDNTGKVWVFRNTTTASGNAISFTAGTSFNVGANPVSLTIGDFNEDGRPDIAVANKAGNSITLLINGYVSGAAPSFANFPNDGGPNTSPDNQTPNENLTVPGANSAPPAIVAAPLHFNNPNNGKPDGKIDLATANSGTNNLSVFQNTSLPVYSTYLGGIGTDQASGIVLSGTTAYIVGTSNSTSFSGAPVPKAANQGGNDAFVVSFNVSTPASATVNWDTFFGGTGNDSGTGIALDGSGNPYISGTTDTGLAAGDLVGSPLQSTFSGTSDAIVGGFNATTGAVTYGSLFGDNTTSGTGIAVDSAGSNIYLTGTTNGLRAGYLTNAFQGTFAGTTNAYVASWVKGQSTVAYGSYIGAGNTTGNGIAVDAAGNAYVVGATDWNGAGMPGTNPNDALTGAGAYNSTVNHGAQDGFLIKIKPGAGAAGVGYFAFLGGAGSDSANGITVNGTYAGAPPNDSASNPSIFITGSTTSAAFPVTNGSGNAGGQDAFLTRIDPKLPTLSSVTGTLNEGDADGADAVTLTGSSFDPRSSVKVQTPGFTAFLSGAAITINGPGTQITFNMPNSVAQPFLREEGTATFTVFDGEGDPSPSPKTLAISDPAPSVNSTHAAFTIAKGGNLGSSAPVLVTFTDPGGAELNGSNPAANEYQVVVNWGDGSPAQTFTSDGGGGNGITFASGVFSFAGNHTYNTAGGFNIGITLEHGPGFAATTSVPNIGVTVVNAPVLGALSQTQWTVNQAGYSGTITVSSGSPPYSNLVSSGLPPGLSATLSGTTITISGTPTTAGTFSAVNLSVQDNASQTGSNTYTITINPALSIAPAALPGADVGVLYNQVITVSGGTKPYTTFTVTPFNAGGTGIAAPTTNAGAGTVTFNSTPTASGTASFTVNVTDTAGATLSQNYTITVNPALSIAPAAAPAGDVGTLYNRVFTVSNGTTPYTTFTVTGFNPGTTGLAAPTTNAGAGTITFNSTPTATGSATFTVNVTDTAGGTLSQNYSITINPALSIAPAALPAGDVGVLYNSVVTISGGTKPYTTFSISGYNDGGTGLAVPTSNAAAGTFTFNSTPSASGTVSFTVNVTDTAGATLTKNYTITINPALSIAPVPAPAGDVGVLYNQVLTVSGGTTPFTTFSVTGYTAGGTGLAAPTVNAAAGTVSFNSTPSASGTVTFTVNVTDTAGGTLSQNYSITINPALSIAPAALPAGDVGVLYNSVVTVSGGTKPYTTFSVSGYSAGGTGLAAPTTNAASGTITFNSTASAAGTVAFTVNVTDTAGGTLTKNYTITINPALSIAPLSAPAGEVSALYTQVFTVSGGTKPYTTFSISGYSAGGTGLAAPTTNAGAGTVTFNSTPTAAGTVTFTVNVIDMAGGTLTQNYSITISPAPTLGALAPTQWTVNQPGDSGTIAISNGTRPFTVSAQANLPPGLAATVTGNTVTFTGTPTTAGTFNNVQITVQDAFNIAVSGTFSITINSAVSVSPLSVTQGRVGQPLSSTLTVSGGTGAYSNLVVSGLPSGLTATLSGSTITVSGTPSTAGSFALTVSVQDSVGASGSTTATLTINPAPTTDAAVPPPFVGVGFTGTMSDTLAPDGQEVLEAVSSAGVLTQFDATGAHQLATGVRSASVAFGSVGEVLAVVYQDGRLFQYDKGGAHFLASGIRSASVALTPAGQEVLEVVFADGTLVQFDAAGAHQLARSVRSASVAFGAIGEVMDVVYADGRLFQYDAAGGHLLASGVEAAGVALSPANAEVLDVVFADGSLWQYDATGGHKLGSL